MAKIIVERGEGSLIDRRSIYRIMIDGVFRGQVASCGMAAFDVPVGTHTVKICIDRYCSAPIKVDVLGSIRLTCRPNIAHAFGMMSLIPVSGWISMREEFDYAAWTHSDRQEVLPRAA